MTKTMKQRYVRSLGLALVLILTGCQGMSTRSTERELSALVEQQRYTAALKQLEQLSAEKGELPAELSSQKPIIEKELNDYVNRIIADSTTLREQDQWLSAIKLLNLALDKNPGEPRMTQAYTALKTEQQTISRTLQIALATNEAKTLPESMKLLQQLAAVEPESAQLNQQRQFTTDQIDYAQQLLLDEGKRLLSKKQWQQAHSVLSLAAPLRPSDEVNTALATADRQLATITQRANRNADAQQQKTIRKQLSLLRSALARDLLNAAVDLGRALTPYENDPEVKKGLEELNTKVDQKVVELTASGQAFYSRGQLDNAIRDWQMALSLQPENADIKERLQRAQRFKANFDKLRESGN